MHVDQKDDFDRLRDLVPGVTTTGALNEARTTPSVGDDDDDEAGEAEVTVPEVETSTDSLRPDESVRRPPRMETSATFAPYGRLIAGTVGVSAARIAKALGVSAAIIKRLARPVGSMKMQRWTAFHVYDPALVHTLSDHPEIAKARNRRGSARGDAAANAAATRRSRIVDRLVEHCHRDDLRRLFESLARTLWSPASEWSLFNSRLYSDLPPKLWDAMDPHEGAYAEAENMIVGILRAMMTGQTWKVNEFGDQDEPLAFRIWRENLTVDGNLHVFQNVFAAAIRHALYDDVSQPKQERRLLALRWLRKNSKRTWPQFE